jgi:hypothetical protein
MNESLEIGSILPYLTKAHKAGFATLVLNPNLNSVREKPLVRPTFEGLFFDF